jgi:squalene-hopene/tetraprenyl-beta-curcumene cyclase
MTSDRSVHPPVLAVTRSSVDEAIHRATQHLFDLQSPSGYWWAELESNVTITAEQIFFRHVMQAPARHEAAKAARYILSQQRDDGTWANWFGGPADLSTTIEAYAALRMAGVPADDPSMTRALAHIRSHGGVKCARVFTKLWLALLGVWPWHKLPILPPEIILLPSWGPLSIYDFGCWARQTVVALSVVMTFRPVVPISSDLGLDSLSVDSPDEPGGRVHAPHQPLLSRLFLKVDRMLRRAERLPWKPLRGVALRKAERWILDRQEADGSWGGIQPPWVYSLMALRCLGYGNDHPVVQRGMAGFYGPTGFSIEDEHSFRLQSCLSPVWDTGLALLALAEASVPGDHPAVRAARDWLIKEQILCGGDWQVRCNARPGGWAFEFENDTYPDIDDTAVVLMALHTVGLDPTVQRSALDRGVEWLLGMQSSNGGWGAFDRNNTRTWPRQIPFADFGEMIDPPSVDVTAHVVECLGRLGWRSDDPPIRRALSYLAREQDEDGSWYGRWGVNRIYGTGAVLPALQAVGVSMDTPQVDRAVSWLLSRQNPDGGWGESVESYHARAWWGRGPSTASQTAWALMALIASGQADHAAVEQGVHFLANTQGERGGWDEPYFTGTGFPTDFMIRYHIYRDVFPLMALGRYREARRAGA